jgi:AcrR family transcriptional regulator
MLTGADMSKKNLRKERELLRQEENRRFILQAAEKVFVQKGYRLATVDDIADEAQFSKATIYRYCESKNDIFFEVIHNVFTESYAGIKKIQSKKLSAEIKIKELIGFIVTTYHKKKNLMRILFLEKSAMIKFLRPGSDSHVTHPDTHPEVTPEIRSLMEKISDVICDIIKEGIEAGEFRDMDVHDASVVLGSLLRGFYFRGPIKDKKYSIKETTDLLHSFFLNGIKKQNKATKGD